MKTIPELKKERLTIRTSEPVRAMVLGLLVDSACKIAKTENREPTEKDIETCARRMYKETEKDIELIAGHGGDSADLEKELVVLKEFLPVQMDEGTIRALVADRDEGDLVKKNMGLLMKELKTIEGMDAALLSKILNEVLK